MTGFLSEILDFFFWVFYYISGFGYEVKVASGATSFYGLVSSKGLAKILTKFSYCLKKDWRKPCENRLLADTTNIITTFPLKLLNDLSSAAATWRYHCVGCSREYNCVYLIVIDHMYFDTDRRSAPFQLYAPYELIFSM